MTFLLPVVTMPVRQGYRLIPAETAGETLRL